MKVLPKKALKTFTTDRGKEFGCYKEVEKINIKVYFADSLMQHGKEVATKIQMGY